MTRRTDRPLRICMLMFHGNMFSGGQGIYLSHLAREYVELGHSVDVICGPPYPRVGPHGLDPRVRLHKVDGTSYYRLVNDKRGLLSRPTPVDLFSPLNFFEMSTTLFSFYTIMSVFSLRALPVFKALHAREPFDVVHDNQSLGHGLLAMQRMGVPVVSTIHHPLRVDAQNAVAREKAFWRKVNRALFYPAFLQTPVARRVDRVITVSQASKRTISKAFGVERDRIEVVPVGIESDDFRPIPDIPKEPGAIIYVGNSEDPNKGIQYLLEALYHLRGRVPFRLTIVGERRGALKYAPELIRRYGLSTMVRFTGRLKRHELIEAYNRAELMACPSLYEGFGMPAAEAMASGLPVVATTGGALPEVVGDEGGAIVVPKADAAALAKAIESVLTADPSERERMGRIGRERIAERFTWRKAAAGRIDVFRRVIAERSGGLAVPSGRVPTG